MDRAEKMLEAALDRVSEVRKWRKHDLCDDLINNMKRRRRKKIYSAKPSVNYDELGRESKILTKAIFRSRILCLFSLSLAILLLHVASSSTHCHELSFTNEPLEGLPNKLVYSGDFSTKKTPFAYAGRKEGPLADFNSGLEEDQNQNQNPNAGLTVDRILRSFPSERTRRLVEMLKARSSDYQVVYLGQSSPEEAEEIAGSEAGSGSGSRGRPKRAATDAATSSRQSNGNVNGNGNGKARVNQVLGSYRTNVVIKAFNYKLRLDLELNNGIIHVNNESFVIHPFYDADLSKKHPHIIYRYQPDTKVSGSDINNGEQAANYRQCGASRLHEWALRQFNKLTPQALNSNNPVDRFERQTLEHANNNKCNKSKSSSQDNICDISNNNRGPDNNNDNTGSSKVRFGKRDVSLTEKYIELALILSQDMFDKRNSSSRIEVLHDAIQIINCLDLYFRSANTRVALIYIETWAYGDQSEINSDVKQTLYNFLEYSTRKLYKVPMDAVHLLTGGHSTVFDHNEMGMSIPDSICSSRAVSVSREASIFEPFIAASTIAHMLGHNLGMEHDHYPPSGTPFEMVREGMKGMLRPNIQQQWENLNTRLEQAGQTQAATTTLLQALANQKLDIRKDPIQQQQHQKQQQPAQHDSSQENSGGLGSDEHEDEIKSRSLPMSSLFGFEGDQTKTSLERTLRTSHEHDELPGNSEYCRFNCLMSERFTYLQPPVSIGNMIQQQVATNNVNHSSVPFSSNIVTMYNSPAETSLNLSQEQQQQLNQEQQQFLNGPTMNQIDNELQHDHLISTSLPYKFSKESIETYHKLLRLGHGICLFNKPSQLEDFKTCGNGIVDKGEDCDCGTFQECLESDSCCDPITCRFKADAECINGACCDRCKLRQKGFVCRKSRGECDLAEYCDGKSSQCSPDVYKQNGHPCSENNGYCYLGQCPSHDLQCAQLWGSDARRADNICYSSFNVNGTVRGNCGYDTALRKYKRCNLDDAMCGTLQCQLGDMKPVTASVEALEFAQPLGTASTTGNHSYSSLNFMSGSTTTTTTNSPNLQVPEFSKKTLRTPDGFHHECKVIIGQSNVNQANLMSSISYVRDGSKCATNKVCFNQTCQPLEGVYRDTFELCPRDKGGKFCSGNGICSTANRCQCNVNWMGHDCSQRILIQQQYDAEKTVQLGPNMIINFDNSSPKQAQQISQLDSSPSTTVLPPATPFAILPSSSSPTSVTPDLDVSTTTEPAQQQTGASQVKSQAASTSTTTSSPTVSSSTVVQDKKKPALGAPGLVVILVSIVAFVYLGFALMANCYRREGLIKPDKVLRHHQMNCKLDAMRSSFIARRLADAEAGAGAAFVMGNNNHNNNNNNDNHPPSPPMEVAQEQQQNTTADIGSTVDLLGGNSFANIGQSSNQAPTNYQHIATGVLFNAAHSNEPIQIPLNYTGSVAEEGIIKSHFMPQTFTLNHQRHHHHHHHQQQQQQQQQARSVMNNNPSGQQFTASVHYFDEPQRGNNQGCIHQKRNNIESLSFETGSGDHIPLLAGAGLTSDHKPLSRPQRPMNQLIMRSFNAPQASNSNQKIYQARYLGQQESFNDNFNSSKPTSMNRNYQQQRNHNTLQAHQHHYTQQPLTLIDRHNRSSQRTMNRATSLGEVRSQQLRQDMISAVQDYDEEVLRSMAAQRALATPVRVSRAKFRRANMEEESCSAPSSPDRRESFWSDADNQQQQLSQLQQQHQRLQQASMMPRYSLTRQQSSSRLSGTVRQQPIQGYHEDAILGAISASSTMMSNQQAQRRSLSSAGNQVDGHRTMQQQSSFVEQVPINGEGAGDEDDKELPPPPPPPLLDDEDDIDADDDEMATEDETDPIPTSSSQQQPPLRTSTKRQSEPLIRSPVHSSSSLRTIRRVPLNSGERDNEQLSLIAQLQQLERVQSLHQKQVAQDKKLATSEGLHEFFSLPLSVQLSALLARSLRDVDSRDVGMAPLEDFLNTLNNSSVATSSRRSFKRSNQQVSKEQPQQQQPITGSWGQRQQTKLQNLQGLINRLQKLHNQTMLQQQLDELNGELDDEVAQRGSRQSTLSRSGRVARSVSRANQTADELLGAREKGVWTRRGGGQTEPSRGAGGETCSGAANKNESVYSMSDSEDGGFGVSEVLLSYTQHKLDANHNQAVKKQEEQSAEKFNLISDQNFSTTNLPAQPKDDPLQQESQHQQQQQAAHLDSPSSNDAQSQIATNNQHHNDSSDINQLESKPTPENAQEKGSKILQTDV